MNFKTIVKIVSLALFVSVFGQNALAMEISREELNNALLEAAIHDNADQLTKLLAAGADVNCKGYDDEWTPTSLILASVYKHPAIVKILLEHGADINCKDNRDDTPLIRASDSACSQIVKMLLDHGADIDCKNMFGKTALDFVMWGSTKRQECKEIALLLTNESQRKTEKAQQQLTENKQALSKNYSS